MKLYRVFLCFVFLGLLAGATYSQTDPGVGLRGTGASSGITGTTFTGTFPGTCTDTNNCGATNFVDYSNANMSGATFVGIQLTFTSEVNLSYTCDNSQDPFFTSCSNDPLNHEVTFSGLSSPVNLSLAAAAASNDCGTGGCQGILFGDHFSLFLESNDTPDFTGMAEVVVTPEPASALLFVIGIGAIALFLKRA
jgi:hypothetical protein